MIIRFRSLKIVPRRPRRGLPALGGGRVKSIQVENNVVMLLIEHTGKSLKIHGKPLKF